MAYKSITIQKAIQLINRKFYLPSLQRPYVWDTKQIELLFDSLMRHYPISSFLLWDIKPSEVQGLDVYKFIPDFIHGSSYNTIAGVEDSEISLVLDGQQRLTSLLIGLRGSYTETKGRNKTPVQKHLYLNTLKFPNDNTGVDEVGFEFSFKVRGQVSDDLNHFWFKVSRILDFSTLEDFQSEIDGVLDQCQQNMQYQYDQLNIIRNNLVSLHKAIWEVDNIAYYTEVQKSHSRVLDIFLRANDAGKKLNKSDLMMSAITTGWNDSNAREDIENLIRSNGGDGARGGKNKWLNIQWLMKACLALCEIGIVYKIENFNKKNIAKIKSNWPAIKVAVNETVMFVNNMGLDAKMLTATTALIPIVFYISRTEFKANSSNTRDERNREIMRVWLLKALLARSFGTASDGKIIAAITVISENLDLGNEDFPADKVHLAINSHDKIRLNDSSAIDDILNISYKEKVYSYLALSLLYPNMNFSQEEFHIDHMYPKSKFSNASLINAGISEGAIATQIENSNKLANLCLITGEENQQKNDTLLGSWLFNKGRHYYESHLIPEGLDLNDLHDFPDFYRRRYELLSLKLSEVLGLEAASEVNKDVEREPISFNINPYLVNGSHYDNYQHWSKSIKDIFCKILMIIKEQWPDVDIYVSANQFRESITVGARRIGENPIVSARCLWFKINESGFSVSFSEILSQLISSEYPWVIDSFCIVNEVMSNSLTIEIDSSSKEFNIEKFSELICNVKSQLPEATYSIGSGNNPSSYT
jgi:Protein of unknown function DUF262